MRNRRAFQLVWIPLWFIVGLVHTAHASGGYHGAHTDSPQETNALAECLRYLGIVWLVGLSAIFSGLTLGLMALDKTGLDVTIGAGEAPGATDDEARNARWAKRILPVRRNGNQLLTTLVLGTVAVNSLLSILMADLTSGLTGFFLSTIVIVLAGEIVPQAIFARHALRVGAALLPLVQLFLLTFYVIAKPISKCLDASLGADVGTIFTKRELQKLLEIHVKQQMLHPDEGTIVRGAMGYRQKRVASVMVPAAQIFSLSISFLAVGVPLPCLPSLVDCINCEFPLTTPSSCVFFLEYASTMLDIATIKTVYQSGFSRIPVWHKDEHDIVGVFLVKDLVMIDPKEGNVPLLDFVQVFGKAAHRVWADATLGDVLKAFKGGNTHMALVFDVNNSGPGDPYYELKGLVTMEDIVEEILQDTIASDTHSAEARHARKQRADRMTMDYV